MVKKLSTAVARADKSLEEEERGKGQAEHLTAHRADGDVQAWVAETSEPRPEDFAKTERMIEDLDARRVSARREMAGGSLLQDEGDKSFFADSKLHRARDGEQGANVNNVSEACGQSMPIGEQIATPTINLIPSDPTRVMITKTTKITPVRPKVAEMEGRKAGAAAAGRAGVPKPLAYDLSNLIEDFEAEDEQIAVSESPEPRASDHAGAVLATEASDDTRQIRFSDHQNAALGAEPATLPDEVKPAWPQTTGLSSDSSQNIPATAKGGEPGRTKSAMPETQPRTGSHEWVADRDPPIPEPHDTELAGNNGPQSGPLNQEVERTNPERQTTALTDEAIEDGPLLDRVGTTETVPIEHLRPNHLQPRRRFDEERIRELADSIEKNGMLQPILVRRHPDPKSEFEIVAGERRYRAAKLARMHEVPVVIRELSDCQALELALVENLQRQDLTPLERAEGYQRLIEGFNRTQEDLARVLCKSRSHIANTLRLLNLPLAIKEMLQQGELSAGHARALLNAERPEELARRVVTKGLSVRETESLTQAREPNQSASRTAKSAKSPEIAALERDLATLLALKITISTHSHGGSLTIHYTSLEQLEDIVRRLSPVECGPDRHPMPDGGFARQSEL